MKNFFGYWNKSNVLLKSINLEVKKGDLVGIFGKVGSGKSSILCAIIGEMPFYKGEIKINGSYGYVEQEPFIFSDTL